MSAYKPFIFANNLRYFLKQKDSTQKDLSDFVGVSPASVTAWIKGEKIPKLDKIERIATFLHVPVETLLADNKPTNEQLKKPPSLEKVAAVPKDATPATDLLQDIFADRPDVLAIMNNKTFVKGQENKPLSPELKLHIRNSLLFALRANGYNV